MMSDCNHALPCVVELSFVSVIMIIYHTHDRNELRLMPYTPLIVMMIIIIIMTPGRDAAAVHNAPK